MDPETIGGVKDAVVVTPSKRVSRKLSAELLVRSTVRVDDDDDDVVVVIVVVLAKQSAGVTLLLSIHATIEMMVQLAAPAVRVRLVLLEQGIFIVFCVKQCKKYREVFINENANSQKKENGFAQDTKNVDIDVNE